MPSYKNKDRGTWYCAFYYQDWTGKRKKKKKEGFATRREAQAFERKFLEEYAGSPEITFESLVQSYLEKARIRVNVPPAYRGGGFLILREQHYSSKELRRLTLSPQA